MESFTWKISQQDLVRGPDVGGRMLVTVFFLSKIIIEETTEYILVLNT